MKKSVIFFIVLVFVNYAYPQRVALVRDNGKFGYIKDDGSWLIEPQYKKAADFSDGMAAVNNGKLWGYINSENKLVIDYQFDKVKKFHSGVAMANKDKHWFYIDKTGNELTSFPEAEKIYDFSESGAAFFKIDDKVGLINTSGKVIAEPVYDRIFKFRGNYAKIEKDKKFGIIDNTGKVVVELIYDDVGNYSKNLTKAQKDGSTGLIIDGRFIPVENCVRIWDFHETQNLTYAESANGMIGFIDRTGKWVIDPQFKKARRFHNGLAPAMGDKKLWGYIDESGNWVIEQQYKDAEIFSDDGLAPVKPSKKWGFIDKTGNMIIKDEYELPQNIFVKHIKGFDHGLVRVKKSKKWGYLDTQGNVLAGKWFENAEDFVKL